MELQMRLPNHYVELEQEEMMYLDGGIAAYVNWRGLSFKLSVNECAMLAGAATAYLDSLVGATGWKYTPKGALTYIVLLAASLVAGIGASASGRGMWVNINWSGIWGRSY